MTFTTPTSPCQTGPGFECVCTIRSTLFARITLVSLVVIAAGGAAWLARCLRDPGSPIHFWWRGSSLASCC